LGCGGRQSVQGALRDAQPLCGLGSVQGVVDFHWTALTMGILPDESLDAFFAFLAIFGL
jgi:hypothetical protein